MKAGALAWVKHKDEADRAVWVDKYRNTTETLGQIIATTLISREAMWEVPQQALSLPPHAPPNPYVDKQQTGQRRDNNQQGGKRPQLASKMRDGTRLCNAYQTGKCKNESCKFAHKCARVTKQGRVCGQRHPASQHDQATSGRW